ncbi:hypothetical protein SDC9_169021 [bioreactor metagenome]|uniref:Transcriptional regulator LacI/GalR-like sensor domain-containing protein n=1 Tax=bioreactor metagenome TaxID=1076179 RepID=A0A645G448_9ZZZZ
MGEVPRDLPFAAFNQVYASCAAKGLDIGEFIARSPFRKVAYFAVPKDMMVYEEEYIDILRNRMEGAGKQLILKRLKFDRHLQARSSRYYEAAVRELFASGERPDLLHFSDQVDVRAIIRIAGEYGLRVPEDLNILTCAQTMLNPVPGIFAVRTDFSKFAAETFDLCGKLAGRNREPEKHNLTHLISHEILKLDFESILDIYC